MRRKLLFEADEEDNTEGFTASSEKEDGADEEENNDTESEDNNTEENNDDDVNEESEEDTSNEDNEDFNIDAEDDGESEDGEEGNNDSGSEDNGGDDDSEEKIENEDTKRDKEIFDSFSPQEQKLKISELNKLYLELYSNCNYIIDKINGIGTPYDELNLQIKKTLAVLYNLKQMVSDYITNLFSSKSYTENDINFNRYLSILNSVKGIIKDINKSIMDEDENK